MSSSDSLSTQLSAEVISSAWLSAFILDLSSPCLSLKNSFTNDSYWRDLLAFTPDFRTLHTLPKIQLFFSTPVSIAQPTGFQVLPGIRHTKDFIQGIIQFQTNIAQCTGVFTLTPSENCSWKARSFVTMVEHFLGEVDHFGVRFGHSPGLPLCPPAEWNAVMEYAVVVVGAGQCGLSVAARLENLGVSTLVVERLSSIGDVWRSRYESLETNTPKAYNHLPFSPFQDRCSEYVPGRDVADYLENYQKALGLHVLTSARISAASYDTLAGTWSLSVIRSGQPSITITTRHLITATGVGTLGGAVSVMPTIPGKRSFLGTVLHSSEYRSSCGGGRKVAVVGAGCSAHDIAQDLTDKGSRTVLVQRSPTAVVSRETIRRLLSVYVGQDKFPTEIADRFYAAFPLSALRASKRDVDKDSDIDRDLRHGLSQCGYLLPEAEDSFLHRLVVRRAGYYIDRGCAKLITSGKITVKSGREISHFSPTGLVFDDGSQVEADLVIFATGYSRTTIKQVAETLFGSEVAGPVRDVGGWDSDCEPAGVWRPSGHKGLWFAEGDLFAARFYSHFLALQIKAREIGLLGPDQGNYIVS
ncbi:FAD/NAD(P)-binding domain-containing protein [Rhizopogon salebrosus TDB-379]|nr:FAD/NAD(P)-binding domain-containing protein [Rhizopogon salebrosus TDB-379]